MPVHGDIVLPGNRYGDRHLPAVQSALYTILLCLNLRPAVSNYAVNKQKYHDKTVLLWGK